MITFKKLYSDLLTRLQPDPVNKSPDRLSLTVVPVAIVEDLTTASQPFSIVGRGWFTQGLLSGVQAIGTLLADTGGLQAGTYLIRVKSYSVQNSRNYDLEMRDAANAATITAQRDWGGASGTQFPSSADWQMIATLINDGERFRATLQTAMIAGDAMQVSLFVQKVG